MCVFRELWEDPSPPAPISCEALEAFCEENSSSCAEEREVCPGLGKLRSALGKGKQQLCLRSGQAASTVLG